MKRIITVLLTAIMAMSFAACSPAEEMKTPAVSDVAQALTDAIEFPEMATQLAEDLQYYGYGDLNTDDIEEVYYAIASSGLTPEEILIVKLKDDSGIADLKTMMEARRDAIAAVAADYTPELMEQIDSAIIETKGAYAYFVISSDNAAAKAVLDEQF